MVQCRCLWLSGVTSALPKPTLSLPTDFDEDGYLDRKDLEQLVNCLTGQDEESGLSSAEMEQLIQNVRPLGQSTGTARPQAQSSVLTFPHRSWRSLTSTRMAPSTSLSSSTLSPAPQTLPGRCSGLLRLPGCITLIAQLALEQS